MTQTELNGAAIIEVLNRHGVEYVVIGAFAAQLYNAPIPVTTAIDFTPARTPDNIVRLDSALTELKAKIRITNAPYELAFAHSPSSIAGIDILNLTCEFGDFDLCCLPSGTSGYDDLVRSAHTIVIGGMSIRVADLSDVIRSKRAAGRTKDLTVLPILVAYADTLDSDSLVIPPEGES
jgi:hypothetical protein